MEKVVGPAWPQLAVCLQPTPPLSEPQGVGPVYLRTPLSLSLCGLAGCLRELDLLPSTCPDLDKEPPLLPRGAGASLIKTLNLWIPL